MDQIPDLAKVDGKWIDTTANEKGREYAEEKITTNQIRNVFSHINSIRSKFYSLDFENIELTLKTELLLLKSKLAYAAGRHSKVKPFQKFMFDIIDSTVNSEDFKTALKNFFYLVEAIIAYHKFYGGKES